MPGGWLTGLREYNAAARFAPLALALVLGLMFLAARGLSRLAAAPRRAAAPWLCGYAAKRNAIATSPTISTAKSNAIFTGWAARRARRAAGPAPGRNRPMTSRGQLEQLREKFGPAIQRADLPDDGRLFVYVEPAAVKSVCQHIFATLDARYVISIGVDDRPYSGRFLVAHNFAFDPDHLLCSVLTFLPADNPRIDSITEVVPAAGWAEREMRDLVGIEPVGHRYLKRLVLPDGWPDGVHPLRKDVPWNHVPAGYDDERQFTFDEPPAGCTVIPFGPFHPTLDEPAHFRLYVEGERVRGCEYRGFMAHRGIEKLAESVLGYNDIPMLAERICGICGCVHSVAYVQAVESAAALRPPPRAEYIRTVMLEIERLHSHLLWTGLACHIVGFDTLWMQSFRIREPVMWIAEKITGNRKTYALCVVGGVRWDITPDWPSCARCSTSWKPSGAPWSPP